MLRALFAVMFWAIFIPCAGLIGIPWTLISGKADFMYHIAMWGARSGVRLSGVRVRIEGRERFDPGLTYIFMCNHVSNLDPPIIVPLIPRRSSVLVKKELFRIPVLNVAMRLADLVPVDRRNREAAIASVERAAEVLRKGLNMTVFPEGTRSADGKLLPFKKGPFYLAIESGYPILPVTIVGTHEIWPKGKFAIKPLTATIVFHEPIDPARFADREALMAKVRAVIESALPQQYKA